MNDRYLEEKEEELQENILNDPSPVNKSSSLADRPIPPYIMEDIRVGMEQYERGEYMDAFEFMEKLKQRYS